MFFAFTTEFCLVLMFAYVIPFNYVIGTRDLIF